MEEKQENLIPEEQEESLPTQEETVAESGYVPRPAWQVWAARIGLVLFIAVVVMFYINLFRAG